MYGPAVRCERFADLAAADLDQCIRTLGAFVLRAIMDIRAHAFGLVYRPPNGPLKSPVFAHARKTDLLFGPLIAFVVKLTFLNSPTARW